LKISSHPSTNRRGHQSSTEDTSYNLFTVTLFNCLKSIHNINVPSFFFMNRTRAPQGDTLGCVYSSEALQDAIATLLALAYSFYKELLTLELLQALSLQRSQYIFSEVVRVPPRIHLQTLLVPHDLQSLRLHPYMFPPHGLQIIDSLFCSTSSYALLRFL
jgi:hypothetical protein